MKTLNKNILKKLILEAINENVGSNVNPTNRFAPTLGRDQGISNYPHGVKPSNADKPSQYKSDPYEPGPIETHIKDGEVYITYGPNRFHLEFTKGSNRSSGKITPVDSYNFTIVNQIIDWHDNTPIDVKNNSDLNKQILDYSGREK